jgi:D-alanyl-D-alanine carboxypeptidase
VRALGASWLLSSVVTGHAAAVNSALDVLVAAYPDHLVSHDRDSVTWADGTVMPVAGGGQQQRSFEELLNAPGILDQFAIPYPLGTKLKTPAVNEDPGRIRNQAFFTKMYGDCRQGDVEKHLRDVAWLPSRGGGALKATSINGVADRLSEVSRELELLPARMMKYLIPSAGTYNCRPIAATERISVHAYGAAIDINDRFSDYWLWTKNKTGHFTWTNRIPLEIVDIFERHGFIWGGKWYHFDTMHFEYRPELIEFAKRGWPRN